MQETRQNTEIQKRTEGPQELTPFESAVVLATAAPRIKELRKIDVANGLTNFISRAFITVGGKPLDSKERDALETLIMDNIWSAYPNLTLLELEIAINKGSLGDFKTKDDEVVMVTPYSVHSWIRSYVSQIKKEAIHKQRLIEYREDKQKLLSKEEKIQVMIHFVHEDIIKPWKEYQASGVYKIQDPVSMIWKTLEELRVIPFSKEERDIIYNEAEAEIRREKTGGATLEAINENRAFMIRMDRGDSVIQTLVKIRARQKGLKMFFEQLRQSNSDLEQIINLKLNS